MMKSSKLLLIIVFVILTSCTSKNLPFEAQHIEKITDNKEFIKIMLQLSAIRIPNGMTGFLIQNNFIGQPYLIPTMIKKLSLSDECTAISDCIGVAYTTVHKTEDQQIMYRIYHRENPLNLDCTWIETYEIGFSTINDELIKQVEGRTQELVNSCFVDK